MTVELYCPRDQIGAKNPNFDLAADYIELTAFFSDQAQACTNDLINAAEIGAEDGYADVEQEMVEREEIVSGAVRRIEARVRALADAYPFMLDETGDILSYTGQTPSHGQAAYILALVLSHLKAVSPVLHGSVVYPDADEISTLRRYFQYVATAALAAEVNGRSWSFGAPRPDGSGFRTKLNEIWGVLRDGVVQKAIGAPAMAKDDQVDVFAARLHPDGLPGFLFAAAQVATGDNWRDKSLRHHLSNVFGSRWFGQQPVTAMLCYHIVPFAIEHDRFFDDCRNLGNVLHRLRVPARVEQARTLHDQGVPIEAYDQLPAVVDWVKKYAARGAAA